MSHICTHDQLAPSLNISVCRKLHPGGAGQTFKCPADQFNIRPVREGNLNLATQSLFKFRKCENFSQFHFLQPRMCHGRADPKASGRDPQLYLRAVGG